MNRIVDAHPYVKKCKKDDWFQAGQRILLDISCQEYWDNFFAPNCIYPIEKYSKKMKHRNISRTKWANNQFVLKQVVDIPGAPLGYKETRTIITYKKVK